MRRLAFACAAVALIAISSCGGEEERGKGPLPPPPASLEVAMREYGYALSRRTLEPGRVVFRARNEGRERHEIVLLRLPRDFPPLDEQLRSKTRRPLATLSTLRRLRPGTSDAFAVDLRPGRYGMLCFVTSPDGQTHGAKGMNAELRVR